MERTECMRACVCVCMLEREKGILPDATGLQSPSSRVYHQREISQLLSLSCLSPAIISSSSSTSFPVFHSYLHPLPPSSPLLSPVLPCLSLSNEVTWGVVFSASELAAGARQKGTRCYQFPVFSYLHTQACTRLLLNIAIFVCFCENPDI